MSAPPVPARRGSTSLFHSIKTAVFSSKEKTVDEQFDEYKGIFDTYAEGLSRLSEQLRKQEDHTAAWAKNNASTWDNMHSLFQGSQHACTSLVERGKNAHDHYCLKALPIAVQYLQSAMDILEGVRRDCGELKARIENRQQKLKDYDYYKAKVSTLISDKEETLAKGKPFKNQDKLDRNLDKLSQAKDEYTAINQSLTDALYAFLVARYDRVRGVIMTMLASERALHRGGVDTLDAVCEGNADAVIDAGVSGIGAGQRATGISADSAFVVPNMSK